MKSLVPEPPLCSKSKLAVVANAQFFKEGVMMASTGFYLLLLTSEVENMIRKLRSDGRVEHEDKQYLCSPPIHVPQDATQGRFFFQFIKLGYSYKYSFTSEQYDSNFGQNFTFDVK